MLINNPDGPKIPSSEITPPETYFSRRTFLRSAALAGGVAATAGLYYFLNRRTASAADVTEKLAVTPAATGPGSPAPALKLTPSQLRALGYNVDPKVDPQTPLDDIAHFNNFYEFGENKRNVADNAKNFVTKPWTLKVDGLVNKPLTFGIEDLQKLGIEERVYRHRCTEAWSMVIPWLGFPLSALLDKVDPKSSAKFVAFESYFDKKQMPDAEYLSWPYLEGLTIDEARHPLAILALGLYGQILLPQNGAPVRLVLPWKYGYKSIKSLVRISLVDTQPTTSWNRDQPQRYGFYSNVNPNLGGQFNEERMPGGNRPTLLYNGYEAQVADLYPGKPNDYF